MEGWFLVQLFCPRSCTCQFRDAISPAQFSRATSGKGNCSSKESPSQNDCFVPLSTSSHQKQFLSAYFSNTFQPNHCITSPTTEPSHHPHITNPTATNDALPRLGRPSLPRRLQNPHPRIQNRLLHHRQPRFASPLSILPSLPLLFLQTTY